MFFLGAKLKSKQLWERKNHHHIYNASLNAYEQANTKIEVFYAVQGKHVDKKDKPRVDALVNGLRRCCTVLEQNVSYASEQSTRKELGPRDFDCVVRFQKEVQTYLDNTLALQARLQKQSDAENYFRKQEEERKSQTTRQEKERLKDKPLPPLRKSVVDFTSGVKSRVTVVPAEQEIDVWLMLETVEYTPIIESYSESKSRFEQDGFLASPRNKLDWI